VRKALFYVLKLSQGRYVEAELQNILGEKDLTKEIRKKLIYQLKILDLQ